MYNRAILLHFQVGVDGGYALANLDFNAETRLSPKFTHCVLASIANVRCALAEILSAGGATISIELPVQPSHLCFKVAEFSQNALHGWRCLGRNALDSLGDTFGNQRCFAGFCAQNRLCQKCGTGSGGGGGGWIDCASRREIRTQSCSIFTACCSIFTACCRISVCKSTLDLVLVAGCAVADLRVSQLQKYLTPRSKTTAAITRIVVDRTVTANGKIIFIAAFHSTTSFSRTFITQQLALAAHSLPQVRCTGTGTHTEPQQWLYRCPCN